MLLGAQRDRERVDAGSAGRFLDRRQKNRVRTEFDKFEVALREKCLERLMEEHRTPQVVRPVFGVERCSLDHAA